MHTYGYSVREFATSRYLFKKDITSKEVLQIVDRKDIESEPYVFLLIAMGSEIELSDGQWISLSDDIWHFDTECIEDHGIYVEILERLIKMSRGDLKITNLSDYVDIEEGEVWISYDYEGKSNRWDLVADDDWFVTDGRICDCN